MEQLKVSDLSFSYPNSDKKALVDVSFTVKRGEFILLCGRSGSGKSTLLSRIKPTAALCGNQSGTILFDGKTLSELSRYDAAARIGFVGQSPENAVVTDKVWHELAFGLEGLGIPNEEIRQRVSEVASYFGLMPIFHKRTDELSGGQKQLLALASVTVMKPELLLLDEPTSRLDPIAAADFFAMLARLNRELGITVLISEHRTEEVFPLADKVAVLSDGALSCFDTPTSVGKALKLCGSRDFTSMPTAMRVWSSVESTLSCPITPLEGKDFLSAYQKEHSLYTVKKEKNAPTFDREVVLTASEVFFRYEPEGDDILRDFSITLYKGESVSLLGGNGVGKSTALSVLSGIKKAYRGSVCGNSAVGYLPQEVRSVFVEKTLYDELYRTLSHSKLSDGQKREKISDILSLCELDGLCERHPYDLSGGEQQRAAIAKLLLLSPKILLLDEPTKGLDAYFKHTLGRLLKKLTALGTTILTVSHDTDFCAEFSDRCMFFFDGSIVSQGTPSEFFGKNSFYTTAASRMARHIDENAVTVADVIALCGGKAEFCDKSDEITVLAPNDEKTRKTNEKTTDSSKLSAKEEKTIEKAGTENLPPKKRLTLRRLSAYACGAVSVGMLLYAASNDFGKLGSTQTGDGLSAKLLLFYAVFFAFLTASFLLFGKTRNSAKGSEIVVSSNADPFGKRKLSRRTRFAIVISLLCIPLTLFAGTFYFSNKSYNLLSFIILLECIFPFFLSFEGRKPSARELTVIASLCAVGIAGRAAFFMLPQFKPVLAVTIISGVCLGGEVGFLVGAVTMLVSNIMFSQGPWTMWQMFAMGLCGLLSGILFRKGVLRPTRMSLASFGALAAIVIYGGIMNPASALLWGGGNLNAKILLAYYISGFPMDCVHAFATAFFLFTCGEGIIEKLERIKTKYGL